MLATAILAEYPTAQAFATAPAPRREPASGRRIDPATKAKVALAAVREDATAAELARQYEVQYADDFVVTAPTRELPVRSMIVFSTETARSTPAKTRPELWISDSSRRSTSAQPQRYGRG